MAQSVIQAMRRNKTFQEAVEAVVESMQSCSYPGIEALLREPTELLRMRYQQGLSLRAIAQVIHCSVPTLKQYLNHWVHPFLFGLLSRWDNDLAILFQDMLDIPPTLQLLLLTKECAYRIH